MNASQIQAEITAENVKLANELHALANELHATKIALNDKQYRNSKLQADYSDLVKRLNSEKDNVNRLRKLLSETVDHLDSLVAETKNMLAAEEWGLNKPAIEQRLREQIKRIESR